MSILLEVIIVKQSSFFVHVGCKIRHKKPFRSLITLIRIVLVRISYRYLLVTVTCYLLVTILSPEPQGNNYNEKLSFGKLR